MEGGREQNYWPGFVDALSNVVLTLVFVIVIFVFALMLSANKVEQKLQQLAEAQKKQEATQAVLTQATATTGASLDDLKYQQEQIEKLTEENKALTQSLTQSSEQLQQLHNTLGLSSEQKVQASADGRELVIVYADNGITLSEQTSKQIDIFIGNLLKKTPQVWHALVIEAPDDPHTASLSLSREIMLGRNLNVRNVLLADNIDPTTIKVRVAAPQAYNGTYSWIKIRAE